MYKGGIRMIEKEILNKTIYKPTAIKRLFSKHPKLREHLVLVYAGLYLIIIAMVAFW